MQVLTSGFGYTGRERDKETGLQYNRARYYDPSTGAFIGQDPIGFAAGDTNLYRYVGNGPLNLIDPYGTSWLNDADAALSEHGIDLYGVVNTADQGFGGYASAGGQKKLSSFIRFRKTFELPVKGLCQYLVKISNEV